jgi:AcrR family transcriptional regulator
MRRSDSAPDVPRPAGPATPGPSPDATGPASAGRPRSEEAHRAILDATLALLAEVGYSALTVEGVAQRAGVGKATIYRRWPSKLPLVIEAFGQLPGLEEADTGDLANDLEQMLRSYLRIYHATRLGAVVPSLAGELPHNPELMELFAPVVKGRRQPLIRALERAAARGEIPPHLDLDLAADLILGPITVRTFFTHTKPGPRIVRPIVEMALEGIRRARRREPEPGA